jgi:putative toxin-antitoxin system antitoxin component (TIGR02293 family)
MPQTMLAETAASFAEFAATFQTAEMFSGADALTLGRAPAASEEPFAVHESLREGLPLEALRNLMRGASALSRQDVLGTAIGVSERTIQRYAAQGATRLPPDASGRLWKLAEIMARAATLFGSRDAGERWLDAPAMALENHRPIELLATPVGVRLVEDLLTRLEYGVHA